MKEHFNEYVKSIETYIMFRIKQEAARLAPELEAKGRAPIALAMGAPVAPPPQFVYDKLAEALKIPQIHTYSSPKGENFYLEAIAKKMKNRFNVELDPQTEIFSLIGSKEGIANFIRALINPTNIEQDKDIILVPDPGYASYSQMIKTNGGITYPISLNKENNYMPDMNKIWENLIKDGLNPSKVKAMMINYPSNPLGATCTKDYLKHVVDFCKEKQIWLMSDAAYCDIYFEEQAKPHSIFEIEGAKDVAVEFYSFSKPYSMTGFRLGWICGNKEAVGTFGRLKSTIDTGLFKALQKCAAAVLNSKEGDEYIEQANKSFKKKQQIVINGFRELGWKIEENDIPKATFYIWLPIPPRYKTSKEFTDDLLKTSGIVVVPGNGFGANGEGWFRLSAVATDEQLMDVIERMKKDGFYFSK
ncbi:MAG TPA: aminotransferase class I/II-fold pyridoxal phosphate-dependent enzyme [Candidatus Limenecus avicola]|uniref:Aminotransferase n=1 Tax=Candidatus Limenecus avicola TaxID=2840847 RepID=A0A9D1N0Y8_9CLOT|nr:aminotransferase class I/II-fold pyridoxal phosphate-dependent enzyme [Candidatus Limenecus avicola]